MRYICPVCGYPKLPYPPADYHICPCCSTEFGNDDADHSHARLREMWVAGGAVWFFGRAPEHWNPWSQLIGAGLYTLPLMAFWRFHSAGFESNVVAENTTILANPTYSLAAA